MQIKIFSDRIDRIGPEIEYWLEKHPRAKVKEVQTTISSTPSFHLDREYPYTQGLETLVKPFALVCVWYEM